MGRNPKRRQADICRLDLRRSNLIPCPAPFLLPGDADFLLFTPVPIFRSYRVEKKAKWNYN